MIPNKKSVQKRRGVKQNKFRLVKVDTAQHQFYSGVPGGGEGVREHYATGHGRRHRGERGTNAPYGFQKRKKIEDFGYFHV